MKMYDIYTAAEQGPARPRRGNSASLERFLETLVGFCANVKGETCVVMKTQTLLDFLKCKY